jgi:predicted  nucleic acid-binding Zn-ribbon protein
MELIVVAVNALPALLADLEEVIRDRNEWADSTRGANKRMREAEERVKLLLCDLEAAQRRLVREAVMATRYANEAGALEGQLADARKREQVLREALVKISNHRPGIGGDGQIARTALAATEVKP